MDYLYNDFINKTIGKIYKFEEVIGGLDSLETQNKGKAKVLIKTEVQGHMQRFNESLETHVQQSVRKLRDFYERHHRRDMEKFYLQNQERNQMEFSLQRNYPAIC